MSRWTHVICDECWDKEGEENDELPILPVRAAQPENNDCCFCGQRTTSGICIRKDPSQVKCGGTHG